jgi:hypothetical protein
VRITGLKFLSAVVGGIKGSNEDAVFEENARFGEAFAFGPSQAGPDEAEGSDDLIGVAFFAGSLDAFVQNGGLFVPSGF